MLLGGDEFGRTQEGNNNAYCQDNEISWLNWQRDEKQNRLLEFTRKLNSAKTPTRGLSPSEVFQGRRVRGGEIKDVMWFNPGGNEMSEENGTRRSCVVSGCSSAATPPI